MSDVWQPSAGRDLLVLRANCNRAVREFFHRRDVLEVETPILGEAATVDPHIDSLSAQVLGARRFLQTSPEFYLKRLLAAGSGDIYSLGKVFRQGERGKRHSPEFTLLEWYRVGWDEQQLMSELAELIQLFLPDVEVAHRSYRQCFLELLGVDPHVASLDELKVCASQHIEIDCAPLCATDWRDLLMTHCVEPNLPKGLVFVHDYPQEQAALARLGHNSQGQCIARRFEAYLDGVELANGYFELTDGQEQERRFRADQAYRQAHGLAYYPYDARLVAALNTGMPSCAGVALGLDRLLMRLAGKSDIHDVLSFSN